MPRHWWHFVSNNEFSISVNTWVASPGDHLARLEEALVRVHAATTAATLPTNLQHVLLNPNERDLATASLPALQALARAMATRVREGEAGAGEEVRPDFGKDFTPVEAGRLRWGGGAPGACADTMEGHLCPYRENTSNTEGTTEEGEEGEECGDGLAVYREEEECGDGLAVYRALTAPSVIRAAALEFLKELDS